MLPLVTLYWRVLQHFILFAASRVRKVSELEVVNCTLKFTFHNYSDLFSVTEVE